MAERSFAPSRKVVAGGLAGAFTVVVIAILRAIGYEPSADLASAITTILSFVVSYIVPNPEQPQ